VRCTAETPETPVQVLVREGVVEVEQTGVPTATQQAAPERLTANMKATADTAARISTARMTPEDVKAHLSWQEGMIAFNGATLAEAAAEFARYSDYRITISDPAVANRTVTGLFSAYNPSGFAVAVGTSLDLRVTTGQHGATIAR
jgi:transmembrane sensor